nr:MAG TPA: hypothetical protein [Crassvirales sp.]
MIPVLAAICARIALSIFSLDSALPLITKFSLL